MTHLGDLPLLVFRPSALASFVSIAAGWASWRWGCSPARSPGRLCSMVVRLSDGCSHTVASLLSRAEACTNHLRKGSRVYVAGRLKSRSWQDEGGQTHYRTEMQADSVLFLDGRQAPAGVQEEELPADLGQAETALEAEQTAEPPRKRDRA